MVGVEQQESLRFIRSLFTKGNVAINLWQNDRGDLLIQLPLRPPYQSVIIYTSEDMLLQFFSNDCTLMQLYQSATSPFGWLYHEQEHTCMYLPDAGFAIRHGRFTYAALQLLP
jgi:hypothetical protein